jgi:hypothetical protein
MTLTPIRLITVAADSGDVNNTELFVQVSSQDRQHSNGKLNSGVRHMFATLGPAQPAT